MSASHDNAASTGPRTSTAHFVTACFALFLVVGSSVGVLGCSTQHDGSESESSTASEHAMSGPSAHPGFRWPEPKIPTFPWPPPPATSEATISHKWLPDRGKSRLSDVAEELTRALREGGFDRWSFLAVPNGFALVSRLEQISADGTPEPVPARWSADMPRVDDMNLWTFVKALFNAHPGFYRVIVFVVTDLPWQRDQDVASRAEARSWLREGLDVLPRDFGDFPYSDEHRTKALVYEFKKESKNAEAEYLKVSRTDADDHLEKAGIARPLSR